jgi:hypothetical protein
MRTGSQPIPSKLTKKLENRQHQLILVAEHSITLDRLIGVEYASYTMVLFANIKERYHGLSQLIQINQSGFKAENE